MENIIEIKNLTFKYNENLIFDELNLEIKKASFTNIIGPNDSGKSTLAKILLGIIKVNGDIKILDKDSICYIPNNINDSIIMDTVLDEIMLNNNVDNEELDDLLREFNLYDKKLENPKNLSGGEQQLMYIASSLLKKTNVIICDDAFSMLDNLVKDKILKQLKKLSKEKNLTIINFTNDTEDILYGDYVAVIANNKIVFNSKKEEIFNNEQLFKKLNLKIPFMVELSQKLRYYNLLNNIEIDMNRMVNKLWK